MERVRSKICGITNEADARTAVEAGADALGFVFYPPSPRHLELEVAVRIARQLPPFISIVALMVNAEAAMVKQVLARLPVSVLQFHGDEEAAFCEQFDHPYIKAIRVKPELDLMCEMGKHPQAQGFLLDTYKKGVPGGTGESFNWELFPRQADKPLILAGGLTPENVGRAVKQTGAYAVDVSGGVEAAAGVKDADKVRQFIANLRDCELDRSRT